jgi:hypothetical protein
MESWLRGIDSKGLDEKDNDEPSSSMPKIAPSIS